MLAAVFNYDAEEEDRRVRRNAKLAGAVFVLGLLGVLIGPRLRTAWTREDAWAGEFVVSRGVGLDEAGGVPWRRVHEELLPSWIVALGGSPSEEEAAFHRLTSALEPDEELRSLAVALREFGRDPAGESEALFDLSRRWSQRLDERGVGWRIEAGVVGGPRPFFYVKSYEVVADGRAKVGEAEHRVRLLRRADNLNVREGWLGHTATVEEGGLVVIHRILDFAADDLWPIFAEDPEDTDPLRRAFARSVMSEARVLPADVLEILRDTAPDRLAMREAWDAVIERTACSHVNVPPVPWNGFDLRGRESIERLVEPYVPCPAVKRGEADALIDGSRSLRRTRDLDRALAYLVGWVARGVSVHELQHAADLGRELSPFESERSAYLTSFSTEGVAAVALFQACVANRDGWGTHAEALADSGLDCAAPPDSPVATAQARLAELGSPYQPVVLPEQFAITLPLPGE